jgi:hypothetical protein
MAAPDGRYNPTIPQDGRANRPAVQSGSAPSFIGQVGYDVPSR